MPCTHGTEKKPGSPNYDYINLGNIFGCVFPSNSNLCNFVATLGQRVELVEINQLCSSVFTAPSPLEPGDFINPAIAAQKLLQNGRATKWLEHCQCKKNPNGGAITPLSYTGGQCPTAYNIQVTSVRSYDGLTSTGWYNNISGKILSISTRKVGASPYQRTQLVVSHQSGNNTVDKVLQDAGEPYTWTINQVVRSDGGLDNCGNPTGVVIPVDETPPPAPPAPVYPPTLPPTPPPICPCSPPDIDLIANLIYLKPEFIAKIALELAFNPQFSINLKGDKGDKGDPGLDGAPGGDGELTQEEHDCLMELCKKVEHLRKSFQDTDGLVSGKEVHLFTSGVVQSGRYIMPGRILEATLTLIDLPNNLPKQAGVTADDVVYAGWFYWLTDSGNSIRRPIHFVHNRFVPALGSKGFSGVGFTLPHGCTGKLTLRYFEPTEQSLDLV